MNQDMETAMKMMLTLQERSETMQRQAKAASLGDKPRMKELGKTIEELTAKHVKLYGQLSDEGQKQYTKFCKDNFVY